jgi:hypothetical protein
MSDVSSDPANANRSASAACPRRQAASTTGALDDPSPLPLDRVVSAFWTEIRSLLSAGSRASDVAEILNRALSEMGYRDAIASIDFTSQIQQLSQTERAL